MENGYSNDNKERLAKFTNSKGISSDDYYGVAKKKSTKAEAGKMIEKAKEVGYELFESAKGKITNVMLNDNY